MSATGKPYRIQRSSSFRTAAYLKPGRAAWLTISVVLALVLVSALVLLSPLLLAWLATDTHVNWSRLSDIGQTYGITSALLSAAALASIGLSLILQARQTRISQVQAARMMQLELFRMALDEPDFQMAWGPGVDLPYVQWRQHSYTNLVFNYLSMNFEIGLVSGDTLRALLSTTFRSAESRAYWVRSRYAWEADNTRSRRRFTQIAQEQYEKAMSQPKATGGLAGREPDTTPAVPIRQQLDGKQLVATALAVATGAAVGAAVAALSRSRKQQIS